MRELSVEIALAASPMRVWRLLTDFEAYGGWNPFQTITGKAEPHASLRILTRYAGGEVFWPSRATVTAFEHGGRIEFSSVRLLLESTRFYRLTHRAGGTTLIHGIRFAGARSKWRIMRGPDVRRATADLEAFGEALQDRISGRRLIALGAGNRRRRRIQKLTEKQKAGR